MQLKLTLKTENPLVLPLGQHSMLQGFLYKHLTAYPEYSEFLHDCGYLDGSHHFKLFVFSTLTGKHSISKGRITYYNDLHLEVRSPDVGFCNVLTNAFQTSDYAELNHQEVSISECVFSKKTIKESTVNIKMLSPLTLSTTYFENEKRKTRYFCPTDPDFNEALNHNAASKFRAAYDEDIPSLITLEPLSFKEDDKYVTKFNGIYINAWNGNYRLSGDPEILTFLYDTGLGAKNSQGFGMFEVV